MSMVGTTRALLAATATAALTVSAMSGGALADGWHGGSFKDAPVESRKLELSATLTGTSDYVWRGFSQSWENPAAQGSVDLSYGIFYAGIWGSNVDFGPGSDANAELNYYTGLKPVWGPVTFDFGAIYYHYPSANDAGAELDFVELKAGYSMESPWIKGLTSGTTLYWTPDYSGELGSVITLESAASYALPKFAIFQPAISGVWGTSYGDRKDGFVFGTNNKDRYSYWSAGLELAVENFTFDFRYWDSDVRGGAGGLADERFVFTTTVSLP
ncbi:TorF family putative porin [Hyphomicrobium sp.]|uniref:TorF family putative porin n=1 Tax=Hyphomicrobium sp. TaxID=82 RepID=UPI002B5FA2A4|nr:TorF family putative porin [Hyphomicrobium sp.]HRN87007.1 TorF family putative porin [Hyphomicrobium sp.]HRQ26748.1 TorF family putative porin [Hyphomicrobium sp.]